MQAMAVEEEYLCVDNGNPTGLVGHSLMPLSCANTLEQDEEEHCTLADDLRIWLVHFSGIRPIQQNPFSIAG